MKRSGEVMSGENTQSARSRRKRVERLKKCIVLTSRLFKLLPLLLCVFLLFRLQVLSRSLAELSSRVEVLTGETSVQQALMQELLEKIQTTGQGAQETNVAGRALPGYELAPPEGLAAAASSDSVKYASEGNDTEEHIGVGSDDSEKPTVHKVYLTFDDGPSTNTKKILDILDQYDVKATFFVVGKEEDWAKEALVDIVERGHSLGMHSYSHKYNTIYDSVEDFAKDFVALRSYLEDVTGVTSNLYRFPGGSSNTISDVDMHEFAEYLDSWDVRFYDWNVASGDGGGRLLTVDELVSNALEGIEDRGTSIILMHDSVNKPTTVEALPKIIENILARENTEILPITEDTVLVQHIHMDDYK